MATDTDFSKVPLEIWLRRAHLWPKLPGLSDFERLTGQAILKATRSVCELPSAKTPILEDPESAYREVIEVQANAEDRDYIAAVHDADVRGVLAQGLRRVICSSTATGEEKRAATVSLIAVAAMCPLEQWEAPSERHSKTTRVALTLKNHPVRILDELATTDVVSGIKDLLREASRRREGTLLVFTDVSVEPSGRLLELLAEVSGLDHGTRLVTTRLRPDKEAEALGLLAKHPDWTKKRIATEVGVHRSTTYRWRKFKDAWKIARHAPPPPRGYKTNTGDVEAYDE